MDKKPEKSIKNIYFVIILRHKISSCFCKSNCNFISVIGCVCFVKHLQKLPHLFVLNLACCDLGVMAINILSIIGMFRGKEFYDRFPAVCEISGTLCMVSCFGSLYTMMMISINRFVLCLFWRHNFCWLVLEAPYFEETYSTCTHI